MFISSKPYHKKILLNFNRVTETWEIIQNISASKEEHLCIWVVMVSELVCEFPVLLTVRDENLKLP